MGTTDISYDVEHVRGMAKNGPMVREIAATMKMPYHGATRAPMPWRFLPDQPTETTPRRGSPQPVMRNPTMAGMVFVPACWPRYGGKIRLPAPKKRAKSMSPMAIKAFFCLFMGFTSDGMRNRAKEIILSMIMWLAEPVNAYRFCKDEINE